MEFVQHGLFDFVEPVCLGDKKPGTSKLTPQIVSEIRSKASEGVSQYAISRRYKISKSLVSYIVNRKVWKEVP